ncbi:MAG TPA: J domain-containing protein [Sphingomicrobium sp.]|nr:J domain-containing protein [Sphingomicrobium sp.]
MTRTHYEIFGVQRTASREEIRAAYLALVKQHHPDVVGGRAPGTPDTIALLNRCYAVLRDPRKRAQYDAQLLRESNDRQLTPYVRRDLVVQHAHGSQRQWRIPLAIAAIAALAIVAQLARATMGESGYAAGGFLSWGREGSDMKLERPLRAADIANQAQLATTVSTDIAIGVSKHCFDAARDADDVASAKLCIIFDDAFLYWRQNANDYDAMPLYFRDEITRMRHLDALGGAGDDTDRVLAQLRDLTFRALLAQLRHDSVSATAVPTPTTSGERGTHRGSEEGTESQNETIGQENSKQPVFN